MNSILPYINIAISFAYHFSHYPFIFNFYDLSLTKEINDFSSLSNPAISLLGFLVLDFSFLPCLLSRHWVDQTFCCCSSFPFPSMKDSKSAKIQFWYIKQKFQNKQLKDMTAFFPSKRSLETKVSTHQLYQDWKGGSTVFRNPAIFPLFAPQFLEHNYRFSRS